MANANGCSSEPAAAAPRFAMLEGVPMVIQLAEPTLVSLLPGVGSLVEATGTGERLADVRFLVIDPTSDPCVSSRISIAGASRSATGAVRSTRGSSRVSSRPSPRHRAAIEAIVPRSRVATVVPRVRRPTIDAVRIAREPDRGRWGRRTRRGASAAPGTDGTRRAERLGRLVEQLDSTIAVLLPTTRPRELEPRVDQQVRGRRSTGPRLEAEVR